MAEPRSGRDMVSRRAAALRPSAIRKFFDRAATMQDVISLGIGEPDFDTPLALRRAAVRSIEEGLTKYTSNYGILPLRQAIGEYTAGLRGIRYEPTTEILVTIGVSEGLDLAFRATLDAGDEVLVPDPAYVNYSAGMILADAVAVPVTTTADRGFRLTADDLRRVITPRTKGIVLGFPSNPTGTVLTPDDIRGIAELAREWDLLVYADEIYDRLVYDVEYRSIIQETGLKERTLYFGGFSKSFAMTGWRIGYACGPATLIAQMIKVRQYTTLCPPNASQYAALEALRTGEPDVVRMVGEYDRRRKRLWQRFNKMGLSCHEPHGAFYAFPKVSDTGLTDDAFCTRLLEEEKVVMIPGSAFGACGAGHARASYATSIDRIDEACDRIERFLGRI